MSQSCERTGYSSYRVTLTGQLHPYPHLYHLHPGRHLKTKINSRLHMWHVFLHPQQQHNSSSRAWTLRYGVTVTTCSSSLKRIWRTISTTRNLTYSCNIYNKKNEKSADCKFPWEKTNLDLWFCIYTLNQLERKQVIFKQVFSNSDYNNIKFLDDN